MVSWHRDQNNDKDQKIHNQRVLYTHTAYGRITHWLNVLLLTLTIITGLYIGNPFIPGIPMRLVLTIHLGVNVVLLPSILGRIYFAIATGDIRHFTFQRGDLNRFKKLMAYYFFLAKEKPYEETKYNVGQRLIYVSWVFAYFFQAITGLILANIAHETAVRASTFFGGPQTIRMLRYLVAIYFVITIIVHIYLATTSDPAKFQAIFSGFVRIKDGKPEE